MSAASQHTPGPFTVPEGNGWRVMAHPLLGNRHQFHQARYIVSADAVVEIYDHEPDVRNQADWDSAWGLRNGVIIAELRDSFRQAEYARLIAAAPDLLAEARDTLPLLDSISEQFTTDDGGLGAMAKRRADAIRAAIAKAEGAK